MGSSNFPRVHNPVLHSNPSNGVHNRPSAIYPPLARYVPLELHRTICRILHDKIIQATYRAFHNHFEENIDDRDKYIVLSSSNFSVADCGGCDGYGFRCVLVC